MFPCSASFGHVTFLFSVSSGLLLIVVCCILIRISGFGWRAAFLLQSSMEQKNFKEWSKEDVRTWAEGFMEAHEARKLFENDMSGLALSHAKSQDLKECGLSGGKSLEVLAKVEGLLGKVLHDFTHFYHHGTHISITFILKCCFASSHA